METPLVSVIVPVYRSLPYLEECLGSIRSQTYEHLQIICVDDGSPDESLAYLNQQAREDERILVLHKENGGQGSARNLGLKKATGEWVCFVDADDAIHPAMVKSLLEAALQAGTRAAWCGLFRGEALTFPWEGGKASFQEVALDEEGLILAYEQEQIHYWICCGALYRREVPASIPFPEGQAFEDNAVSLAWNHTCERAVSTEEKLYFYRQNPDSTTAGGFSARKADFLLALKSQMDYARKKGLRRLARLLSARYVVDSAYLCRLAREAGEKALEASLRRRCLSFWGRHPFLSLQGKGRRVLRDLWG